MALLLHIETATDLCSVGLSEGEEMLVWREAGERYDHAARITLLIDECLAEAGRTLSQLDAVAISRGPGSYTALRIGTATAKGICYALDKPLIAVDTLQSLALASRRSGQPETLYCPMIDARRMEVYTAVFNEANQRLSEIQSMVIDGSSFQNYLSEGRTLILSGNGAEKCLSVLDSPQIHYEPVFCSAVHLLPLALQAFHRENFEDVAYFSPFYLKPPNITKPRKRL